MIGRQCRVYDDTAHTREKWIGFIVCEPQMVHESGDFYVLVEVGGKLKRIDTDFIVMC